MATDKMVLKCGKTGRLFFTSAEATEHAEAFGKEYANFEEVAMDSKIWYCEETGRHTDSEAKMNDQKRRDPDSKTWIEKTVAYLLEVQKKKDDANKRKNKFYDSVNQKKLLVLTEVKQYGKTATAKALHFTRENGTIEAAEKWIEEHKDDPDMGKMDDAFLDSVADDVVMTDADEDVTMEEPDTRQVGDPNPEEVKTFVNQESLKTLMEMGFSEVRAEKGLYSRDNNVEHAIAWMEEHEKDADIDLPLKPKPKVPEKPKISKEEAEAKADEMVKAHRAKKAEEERLAEKEKEANRIESTKKMAETQERLKEEERKRAFEQVRIEKEAHEKHKLQLREQIRLDYIDRFGKEPPTEEDEKEKTIKEKPLREQLKFFITQLKANHKDTNKEGLKTCMQTLKIYATNLKDNPQEMKFKTLKKDNKAFQARVGSFPEALEILDVIGFEEKEAGTGVLTQRSMAPDGFLIGEMIKFVDIIVGQL